MDCPVCLSLEQRDMIATFIKSLLVLAFEHILASNRTLFSGLKLFFALLAIFCLVLSFYNHGKSEKGVVVNRCKR